MICIHAPKPLGTLERLAARFESKALLKGEAATSKSNKRNEISVVC